MLAGFATLANFPTSRNHTVRRQQQPNATMLAYPTENDSDDDGPGWTALPFTPPLAEDDLVQAIEAGPPTSAEEYLQRVM